MKKIFILFPITIAFFISVNTNTQINHTNNKKSITYKTNYQQITTNTNHTLEIKKNTL